MTSFKSINQLLGAIANQDGWQPRRQFNRVVACWFEVVGPVVAAHTRPISMQRQVLQVATSSAAWAQNLAFERRRILDKLNALVPVSLTDIRFSTAQWHSTEQPSLSAELSSTLWKEHPSRLPDAGNSAPPLPDSSELRPQESFQRWAEQIKQRSQHLPLCPQCKCPTPTGELERWSMCALCAAKQW
jgi:predicted nucleic acid-binding Zn ribbon protein